MLVRVYLPVGEILLSEKKRPKKKANKQNEKTIVEDLTRLEISQELCRLKGLNC